MSRRNPTRLLGAERINKRTKRKQHQKDLMHEAKGGELRLNSRVKRGEQKKNAGHRHYHCGCGASGCVGCVPTDKSGTTPVIIKNRKPIGPKRDTTEEIFQRRYEDELKEIRRTGWRKV